MPSKRSTLNFNIVALKSALSRLFPRWIKFKTVTAKRTDVDNTGGVATLRRINLTFALTEEEEIARNDAVTKETQKGLKIAENKEN